MSLRDRILLVLLFILCCYTAVEYSVLKYVIDPELKKQEQEQAKQTLTRCTDALNSQLIDMYNQTCSLGKSGSLSPCTNGASLSLVDLKGNAERFDFILVYDHIWDLQVYNKLDSTLLEQVQMMLFDTRSGFLRNRSLGLSKKGLLCHNENPLLISSAPITDPKNPRRIQGTVITGQFLTSQRLKTLAKQLRLNMDWHILNPTHLSKQAKTILSNITEQQPYYFENPGKQYLYASTVIYDFTHQPALLVNLNQERAIALRGLHTMVLIVCGKIAIGAIAIIFLTFLFHRVITRPILKLIKHITETGHSTSAQKIPELSRKDEIGTLANEFNLMCKRLQDARVKLMEKSYVSGMTEMSSGILHNVRNAISPITNRLERLKSQFEDIPLKNLQQAQTELQNETLDSERRNNLNRFVDLAFDSVVSNLMDVVEGLDDLQAQIFQVEDMLNIQRTFGKADKPVQLIEPSQLVTQALEMIPEEHRRNNRISIHSKLKKLPSVPVEPSTFLQVLQNLLVNASESLDREKPLYRKINITAAIETDNNKEILHWRIKDNGAGITPDKINQIFERGASSKQAGVTGIGLHWCANTITAMRGRIWAESKGLHQGATFHIQIPTTPVEEPVGTVGETTE